MTGISPAIARPANAQANTNAKAKNEATWCALILAAAAMISSIALIPFRLKLGGCRQSCIGLYVVA